MKYVTKPGKDGTLYLFRVEYHDPNDDGFVPSVVCSWGYSAEHVQDKWDGDGDGFVITKISKCKEAK